MPLPLPDTSADIAACRATLRGGSRSFFVASLFLPPPIVRRASAIYAFCREADDLIDGGGGVAAVLQLQNRLDAIYAGRPQPVAADRALASVLNEVRLPRQSFDALIEGFAWDATGRRYETIADLKDYAARVAGSVGILMSVAMERAGASVLARAADLGVAMQLTNIARDVGEDARAGRLYLPARWLREAGIDPEVFLAAPAFTPALGQVVRRLLAEAEPLYRRADAGLAPLPLTCRSGIRIASRLYEAIGTQVLHNGGNSVASRAIVSPTRKVYAMAAQLTRNRDLPAANRLHLPPLAATRFLVEAAARPTLVTASPPWWDLRGRSLQVIDIFERMERAERGTRARA